MVLDMEGDTLQVEFTGGQSVSGPWPFTDRRPGQSFKRVSFDVAARELTFTLLDGQEVAAEIEPDASSGHPSDGCAVVYLDQRDWITLARHEWAKDQLTPGQVAAAGELIALERNKEIILPLSAAHFTETVTNDGPRRRHLAGTMLELSRGWIVRNPVRVRHEEIAAALRGDDPIATGVFTRRPWELFTQDISRTKAPADAAPGWSELFPRLTAVTAVYSALIEDEKVDLTDGLLRADAWAALHARLSEALRDGGASRHDRKLAARARLLDDLKTEVAHAAQQSGLAPEAFTGWLHEQQPYGIESMPYLGRLEQLLLHRLSNADDKWEANDLNDMNFLACAAGYADVVVGERKTVSYLRRANKSLGTRAVVCRTLTEAVTYLNSDAAGAVGAVAAR
jgi:hypothetical protein